MKLKLKISGAPDDRMNLLHFLYSPESLATIDLHIISLLLPAHFHSTNCYRFNYRIIIFNEDGSLIKQVHVRSLRSLLLKGQRY